jgi:glycopeptide antibiotics resistance protein
MLRNAYFNHRLFNALFLTVGIIYALIMIKLLFLRGSSYSWDVYNYNLIPLKTIKRYIMNRNHINSNIWINNLLGNIVLFIPLGIFIPILNKRLLETKLFISTILIALFCVELVQMLTKVGTFDIDDVILNSLGAMIGLVLTKLFIKIGGFSE